MPLSNFGRVAKNLYRGAQPDSHAWDTLRALGVTGAFKLNDEREYPVGREAKEAGPTVQINSFAVGQWSPNEQMVVSAAGNIESWLNTGVAVYVHCSHGRDRTGLVIGAWMLLYRGATFEQVQAERALYGVTGIVALADAEITACLQHIAESRP